MGQVIKNRITGRLTDDVAYSATSIKIDVDTTSTDWPSAFTSEYMYLTIFDPITQEYEVVKVTGTLNTQYPLIKTYRVTRRVDISKGLPSNKVWKANSPIHQLISSQVLLDIVTELTTLVTTNVTQINTKFTAVDSKFVTVNDRIDDVEQAAVASSTDITIYVSKTGSDNNTGRSSTAPFQTLAKAWKTMASTRVSDNASFILRVGGGNWGALAVRVGKYCSSLTIASFTDYSDGVLKDDMPVFSSIAIYGNPTVTIRNVVSTSYVNCIEGAVLYLEKYIKASRFVCHTNSYMFFRTGTYEIDNSITATPNPFECSYVSYMGILSADTVIKFTSAQSYTSGVFGAQFGGVIRVNLSVVSFTGVMPTGNTIKYRCVYNGSIHTAGDASITPGSIDLEIHSGGNFNGKIGTLKVAGPTTISSTSTTDTVTCNTNWGSVFAHTVTKNTTISITSMAAVSDVTIILTNGGSKNIVWPTGVKWPYGLAPTLTVSGVDEINIYRSDSGVLYGSYLLNLR